MKWPIFFWLIGLAILFSVDAHREDRDSSDSEYSKTSDPKVEGIVKKILESLKEVKSEKLAKLTDAQLRQVLKQVIRALKEDFSSKCPPGALLPQRMNLVPMLARLIYSDKFDELLQALLKVHELGLTGGTKYILIPFIKRCLALSIYPNYYRSQMQGELLAGVHQSYIHSLLSWVLQHAVHRYDSVEQALKLIVSTSLTPEARNRPCKDLRPIKEALLKKIAEMKMGLAGGAVDFSKLDYYIGKLIKNAKLKKKVMEAVKKAATPLIEELKKLLIKKLNNNKELYGTKNSKEVDESDDRVERGMLSDIMDPAKGVFSTVKTFIETPAPTAGEVTPSEPPFKPVATTNPPTVKKTVLPTVKKTALPTVKKTVLPTVPTVKKTALPTVPTVKKTVLPTVPKTERPTVKKTELPATSAPPFKGCGHKPADIMFVLDESGSVWNVDFKRQLEFVKSVVRNFDVSANAVHVGIMTFSSKVRFILHLGEKNSFEAIAAAVSKIKQKRGGTFTGDALAFMRNTSFAKPYVRPGVAHVAIVITDGASQQKLETPKQAKLAKDAGIAIFAIGVGKAVIMDELKAMASAPSENYVFLVDNYKALNALKDKFAVKACEVTTKPPIVQPVVATEKPTPKNKMMIEGCRGRRPVDVVFALPNELGIEDTSAAYGFIRAVIKSFKLGPQKVQVGVAKHLCDSMKEIYLNRYKNKKALLHAVGAKRRGAMIDQVIRHMRSVSFDPAHGARTNSSKFGILLVDNKALDEHKTEAEVLLAKKMMQLIVIGIGKNADRVEVATMATTQEDSFMAKDFGDLMTLKAAVLKRLCKVLDEEKPCKKTE